MAWFVMIPPNYRSKSDAEKERVDLRVEFTNPAAIAAVSAGMVINGTNYGSGANPQFSEDLVKWKGPFATEAEAKTAQAPVQIPVNPAENIVNAAENADPLGGIAGALGAFFKAVTDGKMWRSLGWLVLGILLMLFGVLLWIGPAGARRSPFGVVASVAKRAGT
jgi:hypothetical protein